MPIDGKSKKYFGIGFIITATLIIALIMLGLTIWSSDFTLLIAVAVGLLLGILAAYIFYHTFSEQKVLNLPIGEDILLRSRGYAKTYFAFQIDSGKNVNLPPVRANLYLTNLGIIGEIPATGECALYIPHYGIRNFNVVEKLSGTLLRVNFTDVYSLESEVVLYLGEDSNLWFQKLSEILGT